MQCMIEIDTQLLSSIAVISFQCVIVNAMIRENKFSGNEGIFDSTSLSPFNTQF